jgi:hypothetical protein
MNLEFKQRKSLTFYLIFSLYFMIYFCIGIIPANIDNLLLNLKGTTELGISLAITLNLSLEHLHPSYQDLVLILSSSLVKD